MLGKSSEKPSKISIQVFTLIYEVVFIELVNKLIF